MVQGKSPHLPRNAPLHDLVAEPGGELPVEWVEGDA